jgi:hypothetical protein
LPGTGAKVNTLMKTIFAMMGAVGEHVEGRLSS